jgi:hypothetical protein
VVIYLGAWTEEYLREAIKIIGINEVGINAAS